MASLLSPTQDHKCGIEALPVDDAEMGAVEVNNLKTSVYRCMDVPLFLQSVLPQSMP